MLCCAALRYACAVLCLARAPLQGTTYNWTETFAAMELTLQTFADSRSDPTSINWYSWSACRLLPLLNVADCERERTPEHHMQQQVCVPSQSTWLVVDMETRHMTQYQNRHMTIVPDDFLASHAATASVCSYPPDCWSLRGGGGEPPTGVIPAPVAQAEC